MDRIWQITSTDSKSVILKLHGMIRVESARDASKTLDRGELDAKICKVVQVPVLSDNRSNRLAENFTSVVMTEGVRQVSTPEQTREAVLFVESVSSSPSVTPGFDNMDNLKFVELLQHRYRRLEASFNESFALIAKNCDQSAGQERY